MTYPSTIIDEVEGQNLPPSFLRPTSDQRSAAGHDSRDRWAAVASYRTRSFVPFADAFRPPTEAVENGLMLAYTYAGVPKSLAELTFISMEGRGSTSVLEAGRFAYMMSDTDVSPRSGIDEHFIPVALSGHIMSEPVVCTSGGTLTAASVLDDILREEPATFEPLNIRHAPGEALFSEVARLKNGWAGDDAIAPSAAAKLSFLRVLGALGAASDRAEFEVDPSGGEICLRWYAQRSSSAFSLTVSAVGSVVAAATSLKEPGRTWTFDANQVSRIESIFRQVPILSP